MPVTVTEALRKGYNNVKLPSGLLFVAGIIAGFVLHSILGYPGWVFAPTIAGGLLLSCLYWYWRITKWRIWAYENVDHIHEFEQKADDAGYSGLFSELLEIKTDEDKRKLTELQKRFKQKDVYEDDPTVPAETIIYFSKFASKWSMIISGAFIAGGIFALIKGEMLLGLLLAGIGAYFFYDAFKKYNNKVPQLILNPKGIQPIGTAFHDWSVVKNEKVINERDSVRYRNNSTTTTYLVYQFPGGEVKLNIDPLDTDEQALENLMHVYRKRSEKAPH